jgi:hypothetical protein
MAQDSITDWVAQAKQRSEAEKYTAGNRSPRVIRNPKAPSTGEKIMEIAEKLRPWLAQMFEGVRDDNGMLVQPARVRGIALNVAQRIVQDSQKEAAHG